MKGYFAVDKRRLQQRTFKNKEYSKNNSNLIFGHYAIKIISKGRLIVDELIPLKRFLKRVFKGIARVWTRFLPQKVITKKPDESRMGKGKGKFESWVVPVKAGMILFEFSYFQFTREQRNILEIARKKLSVNSKVVTRKI